MALEETIDNVAKSPKRAKNDSTEVEAHSLKDLIDADKYLKASQAKTSPLRGLGFIKFRAGGAVASIRTKE